MIGQRDHRLLLGQSLHLHIADSSSSWIWLPAIFAFNHDDRRRSSFHQLPVRLLDQHFVIKVGYAVESTIKLRERIAEYSR